jgi:hypothetical protein
MHHLTLRSRSIGDGHSWCVLLALLLMMSACTEAVQAPTADVIESDVNTFEVVGSGSVVGAPEGSNGPRPAAGACAADAACVGIFGPLVQCSVAACNLSTGLCVLRPAMDGVPCDDGDTCTAQDVCTFGECLGAARSCDDGNSCTDDSCDILSGGCVNAPNEGACDDGNLCTMDDACVSGICTGPANPICVCNVTNDCGQFEDGDLCNGSLECGTQGLCVMTPGSSVTCDTSQAGPCQSIVCNPQNGACEVQFLANGTLCNDGSACTQFDLCSGGFCVGQPVMCEDHNVCTDDACDPIYGCNFAAVTSPCDDGDLCTVNDTCDGGICVGIDNPGCQCATSAECAQFEDGNLCNGTLVCLNQACVTDALTVVNCAQQAAVAGACQDVICEPNSGLCMTKPALDGTECQDSSACTTTDYCLNGACTGLEDGCDDENPCTQDSCDNGLGCTSLPLTGIPCDDANACTLNDLCIAGGCQGTANPSCQCLHNTDCATYEDGNFCNGTLRCEDGNCKVNPVTIIDCSDAGGCQSATCHPPTGQCLSTPKPNGAPCSDGTACTKSDHCSAGYCVGTPLNCDDGDICTDDICNPQIGCTHEYGLSFCDDGNECTSFDACFFGNCQGFTLATCTCQNNADCAEFDDNDKCNGKLICNGSKCVTNTSTVVKCPPAAAPDCATNQCNASTGKCTLQSAQNNKPCDDGSACTVNDLCQAGQCVGTPTMNCDDGNPCTKDLCQPGSGCYHPNNNGVACDDGDPCSANDSCLNGACMPGPATAACNGACVPAKALTCGNPESGATGGQGHTDAVGQYSCGGGSYNGDEMTYTFVAPYAGSFKAKLTNESGVTDVFILAPSGSGCNPNGCLSKGFTEAEATMIAGQTYYVVVDSNINWSSNYTMTLTCASNGETNCDDNLDNDQDGKVDCADNDCSTAPNCQQAAAGCAQNWQLSCGTTDSAATTSGTATDAVESYPGCNVNYNYPGPEYAYRYQATSSGPVTVTLSNMSADLDVVVLDGAGGCEGPSCTAWGDTTVSFQAVAGKLYYVVVDGYNGVQGSFSISMTCGASTEVFCTDGTDNDGDGKTDCSDSDCVVHPACGGGTPTSETNCTDNWDNDADGKKDCDDPDCSDHPSCGSAGESNCADWIDNDGDGTLDCNDSDCANDAACTPQTETSCVNNIDDDADFLVDCLDPDCATSTACASTGVEQCANDKDDDADGDFDCVDSDCFGHSPQCEPACQATANSYQTLSCPNDSDHWNISGFGSTDAISRYACTAITYDGPEFAYRYVAEQTGQVTVALQLDGVDLDLMILEDTGLGCNPASCNAWGESTATWTATAGKTYYVVLEGYQAATGAYDLTFNCEN